MLWDNILWGCTWCQGPRNRDRIAACAHRLHPLRAEGLVVRADMNPSALLPSIHQIVQRADPEQPISHVRLLEDIVGDRIAPRAAQARVLGGFAGVAMLLAPIGLYGLLAFGVSRRMREIGPADGARRHAGIDDWADRQTGGGAGADWNIAARDSRVAREPAGSYARLRGTGNIDRPERFRCGRARSTACASRSEPGASWPLE